MRADDRYRLPTPLGTLALFAVVAAACERAPTSTSGSAAPDRAAPTTVARAVPSGSAASEEPPPSFDGAAERGDGLRGSTSGRPKIRLGPTTVGPSWSEAAYDRTLRRRGADIRDCWQLVTRDAPTATGRVRVQFTIAATGKVERGSVVDSTVPSDAANACLVRVVESTTFPRPRGGGSLIVTYPFELERQPRP